jgi:hypothetical protein
MSELEALNRRLARAERNVRRLSAVLLVGGATLLLGALRPQDDVLRTQGLVIVDADGRERIVLGAPMQRASADPKLEGAVGMAVLDSAGWLNVAVGTNTPLILDDGAIGTRIATQAGLTFYDPRSGRERGGMGAFTDGRATACLDYGTAVKEAACLFVAPGDQYAAVLVNATPSEEAFDRVTMVVSADGTGVLKAEGGGSEASGVLIKAGNGPASITTYDSTWTAVRDLAGQ